MTQTETIQKEAESNKVFRDVAHVFAQRDRARTVVTLSSLHQTMKKRGYHYDKKDLVPVLTKLASAGIGKLDIDFKGKVRALKDIKVKLQSVGAVAEGGEELANFRQKNQFKEITMPEMKRSEQGPKLVLTALINGKALNIAVPGDFNTADIATLVSCLKDLL